MSVTTVRAAGHRRNGRRAPRLFATAAAQPRARRATDLIMLVGVVLVLAPVSFAAEPSPRFLSSVDSLLQSLPPAFDGVWQLIVDALALLALVLIAGAVVAKRGALARDLIVAGVAAVVLWLVVGRLVSGSWPDLWAALRSAAPPPGYPSARLAVPGAIIMTASPHLARPIRRLGRVLTTFSAIGVVVLGASSALGAIAGVVVAAGAAAITHLVFGSSAGRPGLKDVHLALAELGIVIRGLGAADRQPTGLFLVTAEDDAGDPLVVKVYGRDAHDSALVTTLWRLLWYREPGSPIRLGRLQQVEHEAFLTLLARQEGVSTDTVVTAGATQDDDALLVLRPLGPSMAEGAPDDVARVRPSDVWDLVRVLRTAGIAFGQVDDQHIVVGDNGLGLRDFRGATVAPSDAQERTDDAQALVTTVLVHGQQDALTAAVTALGTEGLAAALPYLQPAALTPRHRRLLKTQSIDLDDLRAAAAEAAGTTPPELQKLRRVTAGSIVRVVLPAVAVIALISGVAGLDLENIVEELQDANWLLIAFGVLLAQTPRFTQAVSTLGASPVPLALGPVYALQLAVSYIGIAIPSAAGRIAINIRFFQRHGVPPGAAIAVGALDGLSGLVVQAFLLAILLLFTSASLDLDLQRGSSTGWGLLVVVIVIAAIALAVVAVVAPWRRFIVQWVRHVVADVFGALRGLRSPRRVGMLIGGNLASEALFALALGTFVRAFGYSVGFEDLLLVNISVSLLSGVIPIPGGIGVAEGGLTFGLVRAGVPEEAAFAAVILYRLATFYLPPVWGFFAMRWLERNKHL